MLKQPNKLVLDVETAGNRFEELDELSKELLLAKTRRKNPSENEQELEGLTEQSLAFYPATGQIVAIAMLNADTEKGVVLFQQQKEKGLPHEEGIEYERLANERDLLLRFWELAEHYEEFITFNGRGFDMPYIMIRSAANNIRCKKDLMANRYLSNQPYGVKHIDLADQLSFYGAKNDWLGLHFWALLFGAPSPKSKDLNGEKVTELFHQDRGDEIAQYCLLDVKATLLVYRKWNEYLRFS